ncbi:hypothetical protein IC582_013963 [Cucumis melo]
MKRGRESPFILFNVQPLSKSNLKQSSLSSSPLQSSTFGHPLSSDKTCRARPRFGYLLSRFKGLWLAVDTAVKILKEGRMDAIKLEGGAHSRITAARAIVDAGIAVMGHVGLTPQAISVLGGFRPQGKNIASAVKVVETAISLQEAGCFAVVLECVPPEVAAAATVALRIPTLGIGAGPFCSGQVLVYHDLLGILQHPHHAKVTPKFCKQFAQIGDVINQALSEYREEVSNGSFPGPLHNPYKISDADLNGFMKELQNMGLDEAASAASAKASG